MKAYCNGRTDNLIAYKGNREPIKLFVGSRLIDALSPTLKSGPNIFNTPYNKALSDIMIPGMSRQEEKQSNNLLDVSKFSIMNSGDVRIVEVGKDYIVLQTFTESNSGFAVSGKNLKDIFPLVKAGQTYTLNGVVEADEGALFVATYAPYRMYLATPWYFANNPRQLSGVRTISDTDSSAEIRFNGPLNLNKSVKLKNLQIVEGEYDASTMPPYEPYGNSPTPEIPSPIVNIDDITLSKTNGTDTVNISVNTVIRSSKNLTYRDELTIDFKTQRAYVDRLIGAYEFTGEETVQYDGTVNTSFYRIELLSSAQIPLTLIGEKQCSDFKEFADTNNPPGDNVFELGLDSSTDKVVFQVYNVNLPSNYSGTTDAEKVTAFKQWLTDRYNAGNPVTVQYPLQNSYRENLSLDNSFFEAFDNTYGTNELNATSEGIENGIEIYTYYYGGGRNDN